ncbi:MAG: hypothetical protein WC689_07080, partial [Methylocystis sp.]
GAGWGGGWRGGWGRPVVGGWGWRRPWARSYWPWYGAGLIGAGYGLGWGSSYYSNIGYGGCYQLRNVWTNWGWRPQWVNVCGGWGGGWGGWNTGWGSGW